MSILFSQSQKELMTTGTNDKRGASVLLVEDEPDVANEVRLELESVGHSIRLAHNVQEGLEIARSGWASVLVIEGMVAPL